MSLQSLHNLLSTNAQDVSSAVFVYTTTPTAPFGESLVKSDPDSAEIWQMETRPGAGSALVGYVESIAFTSKGARAEEKEVEVETIASIPAKRTTASVSAVQKKIKTTSVTATNNKSITVLSSPASFLALVPSLLSLPAGNVRPALSIHVSAQTSYHEIEADSEEEHATLTQVPDLASLFEGVKSLEQGGWTGAVVLSESAEEAALVGTGVGELINAAGFDLINVFDGLTAGRQLGQLAASTIAAPATSSLDSILASALPYFTYSGSATATSVIVLPASTYSASARAASAALTNGGEEVGIMTVRVAKPWNAVAFLAALPTSTKTLHLFNESNTASSISPFNADILATLLTPPGYKLKLRSLNIASTHVPAIAEWASIILNIATPSGAMPATVKSLLPAKAKLAVFWDLDSTSGQTELVASHLARAFGASETGVEAKVETTYDNFKQGGLQCSSLLLEPVGSVNNDFTLSAIAETTPPSLLFISSPAAVLRSYAPISTSTISPNTRIVLSVSWTASEVAEKLPVAAKNALAHISRDKGNLFAVDTDKLAKDNKVQAADVAEVVFWSLYLPSTISSAEIYGLLVRTPSFAKFDTIKLTHLISSVRSAIVHVEVTASWSEVAVVDPAAPVVESLPLRLVATAAGPNPDRTFVDPTAQIHGGAKQSWFSVAQRLLFPEAFKLSNVLEEKMRPDLPEKNYLLTVTENRRLTPGSYDRNVFHLEFSSVGTGLKYSVGEALGIHGWNDEKEVRDFIEWYGLDAEAVVSFPAKNDPSGRVEHRTIFQVFQQTLDIFGKPGKQFYETLSKYATNKDQERALRFIACAEGNATFKKMSDVDTLTYADVMKQFPSARPTIEALIHEIEEIKPRHYSIASSQNFVGDSVHLLVVTVEWNDPKGTFLSFRHFRPSLMRFDIVGTVRYGQCTRYLNNLQVGQQVMVSVKPSVMKVTSTLLPSHILDRVTNNRHQN
jgi:sulfite reductase (NADPH) flavoprotein alpha-component